MSKTSMTLGKTLHLDNKIFAAVMKLFVLLLVVLGVLTEAFRPVSRLSGLRSSVAKSRLDMR